jgi:imidazole glycerol-phosphate synthase subunit HisH
MNTVAIVDYGMANLDSVYRAVEECGGRPVITCHEKEIQDANRIILPGVGSFAEAMHNLKERHLDQILHEHVVEKRIPFLGICLGMQLMATQGFEKQPTHGLRWIPGEVHRLQPKGEDTRIPHVGWNEVHFTRTCPLFSGIETGSNFYFVHSYHLIAHHEEYILGQTDYANGFVSAVQKEWIFGVQFHPEKSQRLGFKVLKNFLSF